MRKEVKEILEEFDFGKVQDVMTYLDWKWWDEVPTMGKLVVRASEILDEAYSGCESLKEEFTISMGGFHAEALYIEGRVKLSLKFVLTEWNNY
jgi:hypothetical protein